MEPTISIITIANKREAYEEFCRSLETQTGIAYELLTIPNYNNEEHSARQAYNRMAQNATGRYLVFTHPDIRFLTPTTLQEIVEQAAELLRDDGIAGVIGVAGADAPMVGHMSTIYSNIYQGSDRSRVGVAVDEPRQVQTVDECLFLVERERFLQEPFSDRDGWHLYAVEYCLQCLRQGRKNYVVPASGIWHLSDGRSLDPAYVAQLRELVETERDHVDCIYTTVKAWKTGGAMAQLYLKYYYYKQCLKRLIR